MILKEKSLFVIPKPHADITDEDVSIAFQELLPGQKQRFLYLRDMSRAISQAWREPC